MSRLAHEDSVDPWAWTRQIEPGGRKPDLSGVRVTAVVVTHNAQRWFDDLLDSLLAQTRQPDRIVVVDAGSLDGTAEAVAECVTEGDVDALVKVPAGATFGDAARAGLSADSADLLWFLHDDVEADPAALERLVGTLVERPDVGVVGPLLLQRGRRGAVPRVAELGQTVTHGGVITMAAVRGQLDQGQLEPSEVLAVSACGMLARRAVWDAVGGFSAEVPSAVQGLEFCWRARAAGHSVVTCPSARLTHWEAGTRGLRGGPTAEADRRRWGMALNEAFRSSRTGLRQRVGAGAAASARIVGYVLGKDLALAGLEWRAVWAWARDRASVRALRARFLASGSTDVTRFRPTRRATAAGALDRLGGRIAEWAASFTDRDPAGGLDTLTGDDFAGPDVPQRGAAPWLLVFVALVVGSGIASRHLFSVAPLAGPQLLPASADMATMLADYLAPIAGRPGSSGPPWVGLGWLASWLTLGQPDLLVSVLLLASVPLNFLVTRRLLRRLVVGRGVALVGAWLYSLGAVLAGAVGSGQLGTVVWAVCLPVLGQVLLTWAEDGDPSWQTVGAAGLTLTVMTAVAPLTWTAAVAALLLLGVRGRSHWGKVAVAALSPAVLAASPWTLLLAAHPGRLLTGLDPTLAPLGAPAVWGLALARPAAAHLPPLWVSAGVLGALWVVAVAGALRRPGRAGWPLAAGAAALLVAAVLTRLVVAVPPAGQARPQASEWLVLMMAALVLAAARGVDGVGASIRGRAFGPRHVAAYLLVLLSAAAVLLASGWWVAAGHAALSRADVGAIPPFVRKDQELGRTRTLALAPDGEEAAWSLLEGDLPRLGRSERGFAVGGNPDMLALAGSVAHRLASGTSDDQIVPDLARLGVGYVWMTGSTPELRLVTDNVPGLAGGTGDDASATWPVPDAGRVVLATGSATVRLDPGQALPAGKEGRLLLLAEPGVSWAALDGQRLARTAAPDGRQAFAVPAQGGRLSMGVDAPPAWWAAGQLAGVLLLVLLAAPSSRSKRAAAGPRRLLEEEE